MQAAGQRCSATRTKLSGPTRKCLIQFHPVHIKLLGLSMSVAGELDRLRAALPGCSLVVFGDLYSQITLCVSTRDKHPQEQLDSICVAAGHLLDSPAAARVASVMGVPDDGKLSRAVVLGPRETQVYLRSPIEDADVLCCLGNLEVDADHTTRQAHSAFKKISETQ